MLSLPNHQIRPLRGEYTSPPRAAAILPPFLSLAPRRDPFDVLTQPIFYIQDLELRACSCSILSWVRLFETAAPLLEAFRLHAEVHRPGTPHDMHDTRAVPPLRNFLATHPRFRRINVNDPFRSGYTPRRSIAFLTHPSKHPHA